MKRLWILLLLLMLAGCEREAPSQPSEPVVTPAVEAPAADAEAVPPPLTDAEGIRVIDLLTTYIAGDPEPVDYAGLVTVQPLPAGVFELGAATEEGGESSDYRYEAVDEAGNAVAGSVALEPGEEAVSAYSPDGETVYLLGEGPEGQFLLLPQGQRIALAEAWGEDVRARWLVGAADGLLVLCPDGQAAAFDLGGRLLWTEAFSGTMEAAFVTASNEIRVLTRWESLPMLQTVDLASGRLTPVGAVPEALCACRLYPGDRWGYDLLALDGEAIYGWRAGETTGYRLCILASFSLEGDRVAGLACMTEDSLLLLCEAEDGAVSRMFLWALPSTMEPEETPTVVPLEEAAAYDKSMAVVKREEELGRTMEVPEEYAWDLMCNLSPHELFAFYDGETRAAATEELEGYGWCWSVAAYSREEYEAWFGRDFDTWVEGGLLPTSRQLGRDDNYMYLFEAPSDVRYDATSPESVESYYRHWLRGYTMLTDFMDRNDITPSPDWDAAYRKEVMGKSSCNGDFETVEFGYGNTAGAEPALLELAARVPNLCCYDGDETLTWQDALTYRLNQAYLFSDVGHSADEKAQVMRSARPVHAYSLYYGEPGTNRSTALAALYDFTAQLQAEPTLAEACQSEAWAIYAAGDVWYLAWPVGQLKTNPAEVQAEILENYEP